MTLEQVAEMKPAYKKQKGHRTLFSHHGLHLSLQATKLLASLTYPLKITKVSPPCLPNMSATYSSSTSDSASGSAGAAGIVGAAGAGST
jgi:hypothetical protein